MAKKVKKTKISNVKAEASAVKTVVNVRIGDTKSKKKTVKRYGGGGGDGGSRSALGIFNRPPIVATQNLAPPPSPAPVNEYNELLRALATERRERMASAPPLAPNTTPLTTNEQRNELLSTPVTRNPLTPIVQAYAIAQENVIDKETYDDPLTNENMFVGSSRLGEKIAPKLPISNFDYNDVSSYDDENSYEQEALEEEVVKTKAGRKYEAVTEAYNSYIDFLNESNQRYAINEPPKSRRSFNSIKKIKDEIRRIQDLVVASQPRKAGKG